MTPFTPISHLERGSQTQLQCPALRQAIFQAARNQFLSLRQAMLSTIADSPLRDEEQRDLEDVYLATTDLQHLAGELSILTDVRKNQSLSRVQIIRLEFERNWPKVILKF